MSGTITADAGDIGGFTINDGRLTAGIGNSSVTMSATDNYLDLVVVLILTKVI